MPIPVAAWVIAGGVVGIGAFVAMHHKEIEEFFDQRKCEMMTTIENLKAELNKEREEKEELRAQMNHSEHEKSHEESHEDLHGKSHEDSLEQSSSSDSSSSDSSSSDSSDCEAGGQVRCKDVYSDLDCEEASSSTLHSHLPKDSILDTEYSEDSRRRNAKNGFTEPTTMRRERFLSERISDSSPSGSDSDDSPWEVV